MILMRRRNLLGFTMCTRRKMLGTRKIRCVLAHDYVLLRQGLRRLLEDEPEFEIVAESDNPVDALKHVLEHRPEIVIANAGMFGFTPDKVELLLRRLSPATRTLFLSINECEKGKDTRTATSCGVKHTSAQELVEKIRQMHSGRGAVRGLPRRGRTEWSDTESPAPPRELTVREREVLKFLAEGRTVRSTAIALGLSIKTVDAHKFNLMRKLGIHNKAELVMWAIRKRLVKIPANF
jgi:two-component system, NarL family, response regulator NreC